MSKRKNKEIEELESTDIVKSKGIIEFFKKLCRCGEEVTFIEGQDEKSCPNCGNDVKIIVNYKNV